MAAAATMEGSPLTEVSDGNIAQFFRGQSVLVTGATGFMGKVLVEKLLRSCPDLDTMYLLMRDKKSEGILERMDKLFADPVFGRISKTQVAKVMPVSGDISLPELGLSKEDRALLSERVSIVFHSAATVRFSDPLRVTLMTNLRGTKEVLELCRGMASLRVLLYVSTAYSHCPKFNIDETVYGVPRPAEELLRCVESMTNEQMELLAPEFIGDWPNSYAFSKALAENLLKDGCGDVPIAIFRPSIVVSTMTEPMPGWNDNLNGPQGIVVGIAMGVVRSLNCDLSKMVDLIPVDLAVNGMIATAWDVATNRKATTVFNYTCGSRNPLMWRQFMDYIVEVGTKSPPSSCLWYYCLFCVINPTLHLLLNMVLHTVPAFFLDGVSLLARKKRRMLRLYEKVHSMTRLSAWFTLHEWNFSDKNVQASIARMSESDRAEFPCDIAAVNWPNFLNVYYLGLRKYLLKDDENNIPESIVRYRKKYLLHRGTQCVVALLGLGLVNKIASTLVQTFA